MANKWKSWLQFQYDPVDIENFTEPESEKGAKMEDISNPDVFKVWKVFQEKSMKDAIAWIPLHRKHFSPSTYDLYTDRPEELEPYKELNPDFIINNCALNNIRHLNTLLCKTSEALVPGGYALFHARTTALEKKIIKETHWPVFAQIRMGLHYFWRRVCPKMPVLRKIYFATTKGKNRSFHRIEILGRICRAGFSIVDEEFIHGEFFVIGKKTREPLWDSPPKCGPVIRLRRIGKDGKIIGVYKFRSMYSYSEYLQDYMYQHGGLQEGGKFENDCRINFWGKLIRKTWIDELPMIVNLIHGHIKLVGVRPLSRQYFSLYSPEMKELRIKVKPGLIPPFYYEKQTPKTIDEVQESERRYIEAYLEHPFRTDWRYFWGSLTNIIFRHKRSN